jgi:hypothetical protein
MTSIDPVDIQQAMNNKLSDTTTILSGISAIATLFESRHSALWFTAFIIIATITILYRSNDRIKHAKFALFIITIILIPISLTPNIPAVVSTISWPAVPFIADSKPQPVLTGDTSYPAKPQSVPTGGTSIPAKPRHAGVIILVPPFENVTGVRSEIKMEKGSDLEDHRSISVISDRYSEAPRTLLEGILVDIPHVSVVERQQLDKLLLESQYSRTSGIVDQKYTMEIGKQLGANAIAMGTIADLNDTDATFQGYGVKTLTKTTTATVRIRLIEISSGKIFFSKTLQGSAKYTTTSYGGNKQSDLAFQAITNALEELRDNPQLMQAIANLK